MARVGQPLLERGAGDHAADRGDADEHALGDVDVAVGGLERGRHAAITTIAASDVPVASRSP